MDQRPRTRQAISKSANPTIQDQVAMGSPVRMTPKWAASATRKRTREITQTANVGALPEELKLRIGVSNRAFVDSETRIRPTLWRGLCGDAPTSRSQQGDHRGRAFCQSRASGIKRSRTSSHVGVNIRRMGKISHVLANNEFKPNGAQRGPRLAAARAAVAVGSTSR